MDQISKLLFSPILYQDSFRFQQSYEPKQETSLTKSKVQLNDLRLLFFLRRGLLQDLTSYDQEKDV